MKFYKNVFGFLVEFNSFREYYRFIIPNIIGQIIGFWLGIGLMYLFFKYFVC